jgi:hypothetical protein
VRAPGIGALNRVTSPGKVTALDGNKQHVPHDPVPDRVPALYERGAFRAQYHHQGHDGITKCVGPIASLFRISIGWRVEERPRVRDVHFHGDSISKICSR